MRYAVIEGATVVNVIVAPDGFELDGVDLVALGPRESVAPGWGYDGQQFTPPGGQEPQEPPPDPEPTPDVVTRDEFNALMTMVFELMGGETA